MESKFIQPSIELLNLRIDEPVTTLTDILLALICFYAFSRFGKHKHSGKAYGYFRYYFLILGLGALTGGFLGHAFQYHLGDGWKLVSWVLTMVSVIVLVQALLVLSAPFLPRSVTVMIFWLNALVFLLALILTLRSICFDPVKYYSIFGLVILASCISYYIYRRTGNRGVVILMGGVGVGFLSAIIFSLQWGFSHWFNHRDVSHIILFFSILLIYKGAVILVGPCPDEAKDKPI